MWIFPLSAKPVNKGVNKLSTHLHSIKTAVNGQQPHKSKNEYIICGEDQEFNHSRYRVIWFCDVESQIEFPLATNLPAEEFSNAEIADIYRCRWLIERLWQFWKMHLKLDKFITKNRNGVMLQIYMIFTAHGNTSHLWG